MALKLAAVMMGIIIRLKLATLTREFYGPQGPWICMAHGCKLKNWCATSTRFGLSTVLRKEKLHAAQLL